jgi:hypothetical protein
VGNVSGTLPHLATGMQTSPDDEVHEPPSKREAPQQLPLHSPEVVYPICDLQHPPPAKKAMRTCDEPFPLLSANNLQVKMLNIIVTVYHIYLAVVFITSLVQ